MNVGVVYRNLKEETLIRTTAWLHVVYSLKLVTSSFDTSLSPQAGTKATRGEIQNMRGLLNFESAEEE